MNSNSMNGTVATTMKKNALTLNKQTVKRLNVQAAQPGAGPQIRAQSWYSIIFLSCDGIC
jgi:hypothetical protein